MKHLVVVLMALLAILHQDFWWWDDRTVLFGFLPIGLAWHGGLSLAASLVWWAVVVYCWPEGLEPHSGAVNAQEQEEGP